MRSSFAMMISVAALLAAAAHGEALDAFLARDGASAYRIVLEPEASPSEKHAAAELQQFFKACTGAELPIAESATEGVPMIVLGYGPIARQIGVDPPESALGEQGYVIRSVPPHLVIAGTRAAGTLYGVYDFLEHQLSVRWFAPDATRTPAGREAL